MNNDGLFSCFDCYRFCPKELTEDEYHNHYNKMINPSLASSSIL